jgi:hypothetical protein
MAEISSDTMARVVVIGTTELRNHGLSRLTADNLITFRVMHAIGVWLERASPKDTWCVTRTGLDVLLNLPGELPPASVDEFFFLRSEFSAWLVYDQRWHCRQLVTLYRMCADLCALEDGWT